MIAIFLLFACAIAAQPKTSRQQPRDQPNDTTDVTRRENERHFQMLADELRAIREQSAQQERARAAHEQDQRSLFFGNEAPVWSNWVLAVIAFFAGVIATRAFNHERDAIRLTERADVLFLKLKLLDPRTNVVSEDVHPWSLIIAVQKNFGRTTATNVCVRWRFFIDGDPIPETPFLPPAIIGAGAELETRIGPNMQTITGDRFNQVPTGHATLRGIGELTYTDVFRKEHHATFRGVFRPGEAGSGAFAIDTEERD